MSNNEDNTRLNKDDITNNQEGEARLKTEAELETGRRQAELTMTEEAVAEIQRDLKRQTTSSAARASKEEQLEELKQEARASGKHPSKDAVTSKIEAESVDDSKPKQSIPEAVYNAFRVQGNQDKGIYYYKDNPEVEAFRDSGKKLETKSSAAYVAKSMIELAESKNWDSIKVTGTEKFKREAWLQASAKGIEVKGYKPTEQDLQDLEKQKKTNTIEQGEKTNDRTSEAEQETETKTTSEMRTTFVDSSKKGLAKAVLEARENNWEKDKSSSSESQAKQLEKEMRELYATSKDKAIEKYPELDKLANLEKGAAEFAKSLADNGKLDAKGQSKFIGAVRDKAIAMAANGRNLAPKAPQKTPEKSHDMER